MRRTQSMSSPGLSLVGFFDAPAALVHLQSVCRVPQSEPERLTDLWQQARQALGAEPPVPSPGVPGLRPLAALDRAHVETLAAQPWVHALLAQTGLPLQLQCAWVEIDPLLVFQPTVTLPRVEAIQAALGPDPGEADVLRLCLPTALPEAQVRVAQTPSGLLLTSECLNFRIQRHGMLSEHLFGVQMGLGLPLVHVVRCDGRYVLHNGMHRAVALRRLGFTHMPALISEVPTADALGLNPPTTFEAGALAGSHPPTVAHFAAGRALPVELRQFQRVVQVSWSEYTTPLD